MKPRTLYLLSVIALALLFVGPRVLIAENLPAGQSDWYCETGACQLHIQNYDGYLLYAVYCNGKFVESDRVNANYNGGDSHCTLVAEYD